MSGPRTRTALQILVAVLIMLLVAWLALSWFTSVDSPTCRVDPTYGPGCD